MRTCIKAWMSLNLGQIPPLTMELAALEHLKNRCHHFFSVAIGPILFNVFDRMLFILAGNEDIHKSLYEFEFRTDPTTDYGVSCLERLKNWCHYVISADIDPIFFKLAGNKDMHNIMNEFEFQPDRTTDYGVSCPWASKKYPHRLIMGKMVFPLFLCCFF